MNGFWSASGAAAHAAIAAGSLWNAAYFVRRTLHGSRARRVAAGTLALLFVGIAVESLAAIAVSSTALEVARRTPLLLATLSIATLVSYGSNTSSSTNGGAR